jgi:hypothetical protein
MFGNEFGDVGRAALQKRFGAALKL